MNSLPTLHAWIDESMHTASSTLSEGIYLLAATVADVADCETVRDVLRLLRLGNGPKLHWKDENPSRRRYLATALSELDLKHTLSLEHLAAGLHRRLGDPAPFDALESRVVVHDLRI